MEIVIADDHTIVREGLVSLLRDHDHIDVVGQAADGLEAMTLVRNLKPDIIIMDVTMPKLNGIDALRQIRSEKLTTKTVILSGHIEKNVIKEALDAGASGFILKADLFEDLHNALNSIMNNGYFLSPKITNVVIADYLNTSVDQLDQNALSPKERQIVQLIADGKSVKEIGLQFNLSPKTVDSHRRKIMTKLQANSIAEITKYAIKEGLTTLDW